MWLFGAFSSAMCGIFPYFSTIKAPYLLFCVKSARRFRRFLLQDSVQTGLSVPELGARALI
jgi:hypothetical protein